MIAPVIVDEFGQPMKKSNGHGRAHLAEALKQTYPPQRRMSATYDAARETPEFTRYWANADNFDADSANSRLVRRNLVSRSRYEVGNNGYANGITATIATDIIGKGPTLRMQTRSENFNRMVEREFMAWAKEIKFRRKLLRSGR